MTTKLALVLTTLTLATAAHAENTMVGGAPMFETKNIVENAVNSEDHTTLVAAVQAAGRPRARWVAHHKNREW